MAYPWELEDMRNATINVMGGGGASRPDSNLMDGKKLYAMLTTASGITSTQHTDCLDAPIFQGYVGDVVPLTTSGDLVWGTSNYNGVTILPYYSPMIPEEKKPMRGLYEVFVVEPETGNIEVFNVVAKDEATARLKGAIEANIQDADEYDILVRLVGPVRAKKATEK